MDIYIPVCPLPKVFCKTYGPTYWDVRGGAAVFDVLTLNDIAKRKQKSLDKQIDLTYVLIEGR